MFGQTPLNPPAYGPVSSVSLNNQKWSWIVSQIIIYHHLWLLPKQNTQNIILIYYLLRSSSKDMLDSTLTKSIGGGALIWCWIEEQAPWTHWIAERNKENVKCSVYVCGMLTCLPLQSVFLYQIVYLRWEENTLKWQTCTNCFCHRKPVVAAA